MHDKKTKSDKEAHAGSRPSRKAKPLSGADIFLGCVHLIAFIFSGLMALRRLSTGYGPYAEFPPLYLLPVVIASLVNTIAFFKQTLFQAAIITNAICIAYFLYRISDWGRLIPIPLFLALFYSLTMIALIVLVKES